MYPVPPEPRAGVPPLQTAFSGDRGLPDGSAPNGADMPSKASRQAEGTPWQPGHPRDGRQPQPPYMLTGGSHNRHTCCRVTATTAIHADGRQPQPPYMLSGDSLNRHTCRRVTATTCKQGRRENPLLDSPPALHIQQTFPALNFKPPLLHCLQAMVICRRALFLTAGH